jgi:large subunit ribosomal protein L18
MIKPKYQIKKKRADRVRKTILKKMNGSAEKPRMIVVRSNKYLYTQVRDDNSGVIVAYASTLEKTLKETLKSKKDTNAAKMLGKIIADRLKEKQIEAVVFDRNVYPYTGRIKIFADSARENGIKF